MFCLDTNIIIDLFRGDETLREKIKGLGDQEIAITPVVLAELYKGAYLSAQSDEALQLVEDFTATAILLPFNKMSCRVFGQHYAKLRKEGRQPQEADLMIASIAQAHQTILVTRNRKDFIHIPGLKMITW